MSENFIAREEFEATISRLDSADQEIERRLIETERVLRTEHTQNLDKAIERWSGELQSMKSDLKEDIDGLDDHLTWQDRTIGGTVILAFMYIILRYAFHI